MGSDLIADLMTFHNASHDLTGYEDGTKIPGQEGSKQPSFRRRLPLTSFVAVQRWVHDLTTSTACRTKRDAAIAAVAIPTRRSRPRRRARM